MSSPVTAFDECSRLSAHIAFGAISIRQVFQMAENARVQFNQMPSSPTIALWKNPPNHFYHAYAGIVILSKSLKMIPNRVTFIAFNVPPF